MCFKKIKTFIAHQFITVGTHEIRIDASYYLEYQLFYVSINAIEFNVVN